VEMTSLEDRGECARRDSPASLEFSRERQDDTATFRRRRSEFVNQACKSWRIDDFVRGGAVWKEGQDAFANAFDEQLGFSTRHSRLHDETCRYIDKLSNFPHSTRLIRQLLRCRHIYPVFVWP